MSKPTIGFIGLGAMGAAMVGQLQRNGYSLFVLANRSRAAVDAAVADGATEVNSAREVAAHSDITMLCMDTSKSVESRMLGDDGVIAGLSDSDSDGKVVIDFGTSLPDSTRRLGDEVAKHGAQMLDSPIGRTPAHAREGKLNLMASGDRAAFDRVEPVLQVLGENVFYFGELGTGHTIKLINNFVGMTAASAIAEGFAVAEAAGLDKQKLYDAMSSGPLHSGMMDFVKAYAIDGDRDMLQFSIRNALKDVTYYNAMADAVPTSTVVSAGTKQALGLASNSGFGDRHVSELFDFFRQYDGSKTD